MKWFLGLVVTLYLCDASLARLSDVFHFDNSIKDEAEGLLLKYFSKNTVPDHSKPLDILSIFKHWRDVSHRSTKLSAFSWKNCGQAGDMFHLDKLSISPDPVALPGTISINFTMNILKSIVAPLPAKVLIEVKLSTGGFEPIPCVDNFGSCSYSDFCDILGLIPACPPEFIQAGIPCQCPFKQGNYTLPNITFEVAGAILPAGDYRAQINADISGKHFGCVQVQFSIIDG